MTGVHGLQHVERLRTTAFSDDDPVWPHAERVAHEVPDTDFAGPLCIGRASLEGHDVLTLNLQFRRFFDRDQALTVGDEVGQHVQHRRFSGTRTTNHDQADLSSHQRFQEHGGIHAQRAQADEVLHDKSPLREFPDGEHGPVQRERRHDGIDSRAVGETGVHHRRGLVDAATDSVHHPVDDPSVLMGRVEDNVAALQLALTLDPDLVELVAHDLGDAAVGEQRLQRPIAEGIFEHLLHEALAFDGRDSDVLVVEDVIDGGTDLLAQLLW